MGKRIDSKGGVTVEDDEKRGVESQDPEGGPEDTVKLGRLAVQTGIFPIYEVEAGQYAQTLKTPSRKPVLEYLKLQGRFKHLKEEDVAEIQKIVDLRYAELEKRFQG